MTHNALNRRAFIKAGTLGTAALGLGISLASADKKKIPVGVQLYSVREQAKKDLPGVIAKIGKMGYDGVEYAGYHNFKAAELRKMQDDNGLVCCGTHTPLDTIKPDKLEETIEFNKTLGNKFLIVPYMTAGSRQGWLDHAKLFDDVADKVKAHGMHVGYHAHAHDFKLVDGTPAWDIFFGATKPEVVMQLDTSNCREGGQDPVEVLKRYMGRGLSIHLKAHDPANPEAVIGEGDVKWPEVIRLCEKQGTQWFVIEHEKSKDPLDAIRRCREGLKKFGY